MNKIIKTKGTINKSFDSEGHKTTFWATSEDPAFKLSFK